MDAITGDTPIPSKTNLPDTTSDRLINGDSRRDISGRTLHILIGLAGLGVMFYLAIRNLLPLDWQRPGSPPLQSAAALGSLLLLVPYLFSLGKRSGASRAPNTLFVWHVGSAVAGLFLVMLHALASISGPPLILVIILFALVISGFIGRVSMAPCMATTFGSKPAPFLPPDPGLKSRLEEIIRLKTDLLSELHPGASESLFSVTLRHWLRSPRRSWAYARLAREESSLIGTRRSVSGMQAWWRPLHLGLAWVFLVGLMVHIVLALFFAGYVADGGEIYWWHIAS